MATLKFVIIASCILMVLAGTVHCTKKKRRPSDSGRIVNGEVAEHKRFPFIVSVEVYLYSKSDWSSTCGGSIVNRKTILTACHCVTSDEKIHGSTKYMASPDSLRVVAGTGFWSRNTPTKQIRNVKRLVTHPKCENFYRADKSFMNDVALIFLEKPLVYNAQVWPMRVPNTNIPNAVRYLKGLVYNGASCTTIGWGRTVESQSAQAKVLQATTVQLLDPSTCRDRFCTMMNDHCNTDFEGHGQICVASPTSSDCFGDSGGPLVCNGFVVGTVSYGDRCLPRLPTVFQGLRPILELLVANNVKIDHN